MVMGLKDQLAKRDIVIWTVGFHPEADFRIQQIDTHPFGLDVQIMATGEAFRFPVALSGTFQAVNAVMAAAAAYASGMPLQDSFGALSALTPVRGRMQPVYGHPAGARIIIDFAHTPDALDAALDALRAQTPDKLKVVFGCGGDRDKNKRKKMGAIAARLADEVIITDDNPRSEDPAAIRAEIRKGCPNAIEISPRDEAIKTAIAALAGGDTLLIAGKGHETSQMIGTETLPFDDASVARHALSQLGERQVR
jgi:UDP-N-acetylmuramoyl-L-alanyl-D-glutamate--2,6-diaminopimelate ligase